jgi:flagellar hook-basal body complex protein FliE
MADPLSALRAYTAAARQASAAVGPAAGADPATPSFGSMVADAVRDTEASLKTAETMTQQAAAGRAELVDVATAIAAAEVSLETVVTLRDQVVQAYQEILRMPI